VKREIYTTIANQTYDAQQPAAASVVQQAIADLQANPGLVTARRSLKFWGRRRTRTRPPRQRS
jgi:hypothetical protein